MWALIVQVEHFTVITPQTMIMRLSHRFELVCVCHYFNALMYHRHFRFSANTNDSMFLFNIKCKSP